MTINPYEVLGVRQGADLDEIKRAYRSKARECHPDLHPEDPRANEKMQRINEAYEMLSHPDKFRAQQARPEAEYDAPRGYDGYARQGRAYGQGGWQYTYYTGDPEAFRAWQRSWQQAYAQQEQAAREAAARRQGWRRETRPARPFRGLARFIAGIMVFRVVVSILRVLMFGFLR